jgi:hypothetical protein
MSAEESARFMQRYKESLSGYTYLLWESPTTTYNNVVAGDFSEQKGKVAQGS